jgi:uncharacterized membrane protein
MKAIGIALWAIPIILVGYFSNQKDFSMLLIGSSLSFSGYLYLNTKCDLGIRQTILWAFLVRLALVPAFPLLSDDVYRYLWDGLTWWNGLDAYSQTPRQISEIIQRPDLLAKMNSPDYHAIYPPFVQSLFALLAKMSSGDLHMFTVGLKAILLLTEIGITFLLIRLSTILKSGSSAYVWYLLNPLVIIETAGNAHFEVLMLFFTLLAVFFFVRSGFWAAGMALATAILSKFIPLLLIPAFVFRNWKSSWKFILGLTLILSLGVIPVLKAIDPALGLMDSLGLFVRTFEFNPSVYAVARNLGIMIVGYNPIQWVGPALSLIAGFTILFISWKHRMTTPVQWVAVLSSVFVLQLIFATTVHPWYIILPLGLSLLANQTYVMVWSYLVLLSYSHYSDHPREVFIAIEYLVLLGYMVIQKESPLHFRATGH